MSQTMVSRVVFRYVPPERVIWFNDRLEGAGRIVQIGVLGGFLLYCTYNYRGRRVKRSEPLAETVGIDGLLPYPRTIPIAIILCSVVFAGFLFAVSILAYRAEDLLERSDGG